MLHVEKSMTRNFFQIAKRIYYKIPNSIRRILLPLLLIYKLIKLLKVLRPQVWIIKGDEISSNHELAIIYAGCKGANKNFVADMAFGSSFSEYCIGKKWLWRIPKGAKECNHSCGLMVAEVPSYFHILSNKLKCFYVPSWIDWEVDVSSYLKKDSVKTDARAIRKNNLDFELTNSRSELRNFYNNMYVPHLTNVYGNRAVIASYDHVEKEFGEHGQYKDLLLIKKGKDYIAGALLGRQKNITRLWEIGVKDSNMDFVKDGAIRALFYFFSLSYSAARGFTKVSFGASRPFLKDGIFEFKKKRGLSIVNTYKTGFLIKPLSGTRSVRGFFLKNPFIYEDKSGLHSAIFVTSDQSLSKNDFSRIYKDYYLNGLSKLVIYKFGRTDRDIQNIDLPEFSCVIEVRSAESIFCDA